MSRPISRAVVRLSVKPRDGETRQVFFFFFFSFFAGRLGTCCIPAIGLCGRALSMVLLLLREREREREGGGREGEGRPRVTVELE